MYQLNQKIAHLCHGEESLGSNFAVLRSMWEKLDHYETCKPACQKDIVVYKEKVERTRIIDFLAGLNTEFKLVQVQIHSRDELPSFNEVYAFTVV